jgi:hypothetical protein
LRLAAKRFWNVPASGRVDAITFCAEHFSALLPPQERTASIRNMLSRHKTTVIFWIAVFLSLGSLALLTTTDTWALIVLALSLAFNLWSVIKNDREGFIQSRQMRRAHEPARHFNAPQVLVIFLLMMGQIGLGAYHLIA